MRVTINNTYYEVNFLAIDPMCPLSFNFNKYFELEVSNVEKTSTNLTSNENITILFLDSLIYGHIKEGELVKVWVEPVSDRNVNQNLDITLYKTSEFMEGSDVEVLTSTIGNDAETTETKQTSGFTGVLGLIIIFFTKKFMPNIMKSKSVS